MKTCLLLSAAALINSVYCLPQGSPSELPEEPIVLDDDYGIVGGNPVGSADKYPFITSLQRLPVGPGKSFCGGSLIAPHIIMTAGHCTMGNGYVRGYGATSRRYDITKTSLVEGGIDFNVTKFIRHPDYTTVNGAPINDIALWIVKVDKNWANKPIATVKFSVDEKDMSYPSNITVIGWGTTSEGGRPSDLLREVDVPVVTNDECKQMYSSNAAAIVPSVFCAGAQGIDSCQGDSGGPIFTIINGEPVVHGLTSWGAGCARKGKPGVYTRVASFSKWIQSVIDANPATFEEPEAASEEPEEPLWD